MTTQEQMNANRSNAERSTGPINTENTRFNAVKHGILSGKIIIHNIENLQEYNGFLESFRKDLNPENIVQETIVEKIVIDFWRLQRLLRFERSKIRERLGSLNTFHRLYLDHDFKQAIQETYERTIKELESARNEQGAEKIRELEMRKLGLEDEVKKFRMAASMNIEEEAESRMFPSSEVVDLLIRYENNLGRSIVRWLEVLEHLKFGSFGKNRGAQNG